MSMNTSTRIRISALTTAMTMVLSAGAMAASTGDQTVTYTVPEMADIVISGSPGAMTITAPAAGADPAPVTDATTSWSVTSNAGTDAKKLTAALDADMATGLTLKVTVTAPDGAASSQQTLTAAGVDVVTGIDSVSETGLGIEYELTATVEAAAATSVEKTVTFTLVDAI
ncbi:hypothetical protein F2Q65_16655 [Thiohalocapsa marina]|uniref:DUF4402 domain-containing protein n=1 Tax=Thiohalocapsa marina TaxID=424902 RepID=A0A5M8FIS4_9GAMM|nr:hypothetical protein [Thiohalocapsa marina]KAA6183051.1 hypothetical protein F2Q65_16655 [Thiohalocapsa marina]